MYAFHLKSLPLHEHHPSPTKTLAPDLPKSQVRLTLDLPPYSRCYEGLTWCVLKLDIKEDEEEEEKTRALLKVQVAV